MVQKYFFFLSKTKFSVWCIFQKTIMFITIYCIIFISFLILITSYLITFQRVLIIINFLFVHEVHLIIIIYLKLDLATEKSNKLTENNTNFTKTKIQHPNFISYTNRLYFIARLIKKEKKIFLIPRLSRYIK